MRFWLDCQRRLCRIFDLLLSPEWNLDGNSDFLRTIVPENVGWGETVVDIGGGRTPAISVSLKRSRNLTVEGLDIDPDNLAAAPDGAYDRIRVADLVEDPGEQRADLAICQALLEHVPDTDRAFRAIGSLLKPGGRLLLFVPSKNAVFARIARILPVGTKRLLLGILYPEATGSRGFPSFYDRCTPREFRELALRHGFEVVELRTYFISTYFGFFLPVYALWRCWMVFFRRIAGDEAAETFAMVLRKSG